jgi:hypothetical protein
MTSGIKVSGPLRVVISHISYSGLIVPQLLAGSEYEICKVACRLVIVGYK